jgi:SH3-like domain-containing protein
MLIIAFNKVDASKKNKYLTTRYDEVNVRNGPGLNNLILFKILRKGYPLLVIEKFENWYRVVDFSDNKGWVSKTQLSSESFAIIINGSEKIVKFPNHNSKVLAFVKKKFILKLEKCRKKWCKVSSDKIKGWVPKKSLWGVD